jgi:hypothetical protein
MQEESDNWKEKKHMTCMHEIPNNARVRVLLIHFNGW